MANNASCGVCGEDAAKYSLVLHGFDIVGCIGATWIGNGFAGTIGLMKPALAPKGLLLIEEPYRIETPSESVYEAWGVKPDDYVTLEITSDRFESSGLNLVEMVLASDDGWDRDEAPR